MNRTYHRRWLRFTKGGKMKYIGHLDLMRVFQSAIRRAKLPIAYSMGFNPHQRISFAMPLPVGMDSVCEYMELLLDEPEDIMALGEHLPNGLVPLTSWAIPENAPSPAAAVRAVDYRLAFSEVREYKGRIEELLAAPEIFVTKKTKKGEATVDIKPNILALEYDPVGAVMMRIANNLGPNHIAKLICPDINSANITRLEIYGSLRPADMSEIPRASNHALVPLHEAVID